jgi:hypothetical protein
MPKRFIVNQYARRSAHFSVNSYDINHPLCATASGGVAYSDMDPCRLVAVTVAATRGLRLYGPPLTIRSYVTRSHLEEEVSSRCL